MGAVLNRDKVLEIGPGLKEITKAGHVFTLVPPYQSSGNVFILNCNILN